MSKTGSEHQQQPKKQRYLWSNVVVRRSEIGANWLINCHVCYHSIKALANAITGNVLSWKQSFCYPVCICWGFRVFCFVVYLNVNNDNSNTGVIWNLVLVKTSVPQLNRFVYSCGCLFTNKCFPSLHNHLKGLHVQMLSSLCSTGMSPLTR